ncbi:MAG: SAM-dependent DNA methyltransferase [Verrucomicrobia bacterium]|nr:SAM-dependent DNA methyltransferase [Verrucomicrobiota bacterium]MCH8511143.1 type I restriction-modification system subunit M [Kiritimatiellia bacterium]
MDHAAHNKIVSFIWSIADDCLRDVFVRGKYRDVILPMFVLRRIDCLLEDSKQAVLDEVDFQKREARMAVLDPEGLRDAAGQVFYNTSKFTLKTLLGNPSQLEANFAHYLDGFSENVAEIIDKFDLRNQIRKMAAADALHGVIEKFVSPEINLSPHDTTAPDSRKLPGLSNLGMGHVFEELIRKFNEENNEEAGEHFTPREVIQLMVHLLFEPVKGDLPPVITIYDPACGSGGMLTEAQDYLLDPEGAFRSDAAIYLYGKEVNPETYAICKSDMMIKGNNPENIKYGSTLATDAFAGLRFDFALSNPPYGKSWKTDQGQILEKQGSKIEVIDPRFEVVVNDAFGAPQTVNATPAVDDGQLLFLMEMVDKMKTRTDSPRGGRIASVHNGSALFTGNAGGGASNIRQYLIENDLLDAIIQLPNNIFYNTGITTYIWVLSNHKPAARQGKVQLIDASGLYEKLRKNLGEKNCAFTAAHIEQITRAYLEMSDTGKEAVDGLKSKIFDGRQFGYWKITVERPLRKAAKFTPERVDTLRFDKRMTEEMAWIHAQWGDAVYEPGFLKQKKAELDRWLEEQGIERKASDKKKLLDVKFWAAKRELLEAARALAAEVGDAESRDFNKFEKRVKKAAKTLGLKLGAPQLKQILDAVSWTDPDAEPVRAKDGYEADSDLRDTENVPLDWLEDETDARTVIQAYFDQEVKPHVPQAWIAWDKTTVGYEISFNKYFYVHQPLRDLAEVVREIRELEAETEGLLEKILDFGISTTDGHG